MLHAPATQPFVTVSIAAAFAAFAFAVSAAVPLAAKWSIKAFLTEVSDNLWVFSFLM
jgi:hypothetical protein